MQYPDNVSPIELQPITQQKISSAATAARGLGLITLIGAIVSFTSFLVYKPKPAATLKEGLDDTAAKVIESSNYASMVLSLAMSCIVFYLLNKFASRTQAAFNAKNTQHLEQGAAALAGYFKLAGIVLLMGAVFIILALFMTMMGSSMG